MFNDEKNMSGVLIKFIFSKKSTKNCEIFTADFTFTYLVVLKCQIDGEDFVIFCGLLGKHKLYFVTYGL